MKARRQPEGVLSDAIRARLALLGVDVLRNSQGVQRSGGFYRTGLGVGSSDLVCVVPIALPAEPKGKLLCGRAAFLEVKRPGEVPTEERIAAIRRELPINRTKDEARDLAQWDWLEERRKRGAFAAYVSSVEDAVAAIARARTGATS